MIKALDDFLNYPLVDLTKTNYNIKNTLHELQNVVNKSLMIHHSQNNSKAKSMYIIGFWSHNVRMNISKF